MTLTLRRPSRAGVDRGRIGQASAGRRLLASAEFYVDGSTGSTFADLAGPAGTVVEHGNPAHNGVDGWACDGIGDYWTVAGPTVTEEITALVCVTFDENASLKRPMAWKDGTATTARGWDLRRTSGAGVRVATGDGTSVVQTVSPTVVVAATRYVYAVTITPTTSQFLYLDGSTEDFDVVSGLGTISAATGTLTVAAGEGGTTPIIGTLHAAALWDRALTGPEVGDVSAVFT